MCDTRFVTPTRSCLTESIVGETRYMVMQAVQEHPKRTAIEHRQHLQLQVSVDTIWRRLHAAGIHYSFPVRKRKFTEAHHAGRFEFASQHVGQGLDSGPELFSPMRKCSDHLIMDRNVWTVNNTRYCDITLLPVTKL